MSDVLKLITEYPNIYFTTAHTTPIHGKIWVNIFNGYNFKDSWKDAFVKYPERFIFALDNVWDYHWQEGRYNT